MDTLTPEISWINTLQKQWPQSDLQHDTFVGPHRQILTVDMLIEGVHFDLNYFSPADVGWKSVAASLSDIAATGGVPQWVLVAIGCPPAAAENMLSGVYEGINSACRMYGCQLAGGDTVQADKLTISVTIIGVIPAQYQAGRRNTAQPGDIVAVSGNHGLSCAGLQAFTTRQPGFDRLKQRHLRPQPRLKLGRQIACVVPRYAMMDTSDGLADAALRLAQASQVDIRLEASRIAIDDELSDLATLLKADPLDWVLYGGEDFELMVTMPPETVGLFPALMPIGSVHPKKDADAQAMLITADNQLAVLSPQKTYQHFSPAAAL